MLAPEFPLLCKTIMIRWLIAAFLLTLSMAAQAGSDAWPDLPQTCFVSGRPATVADVKAGCAVFVATSNGKPVGKPLDIEIPQYAMHTDKKTGKKTRVIVIQAEEAQGMKLVGYRIAGSRRKVVDVLDSLQLLGADKPH
jgi:hypothetical protein